MFRIIRDVHKLVTADNAFIDARLNYEIYLMKFLIDVFNHNANSFHNKGTDKGKEKGAFM